MATTFLSPLHRAVRQVALHMESLCQPLGLTPREGHMLAYLRSYSPASMGELHRVFGVPRSTLTGVIDRLSRMGLVARQENERDRRSLRIHITRDGIDTATRLQQHVDHLEAAVRRSISGDDLDGFNNVIEAIGEVTGIDVRKKDKEDRK